ncbi:hypothetical protein TPY_2490 [Sulfobacillus acidophilus TPY]|uniref:Uncharacterized protein n=1 Tax=Sulfobacillus acidophilus (strain ATCC 700253 / DSM 10332 / NAL) TaxID=679936 RepID=G8TSJ8_SULAD|nr:hypothetical protein TPY_2490 [Sulfobacillus acidophilus TPY]AEW06690.1 hypothetical protein Sulac_3244 [Sulfobacillus acidophilus DSM 10332]
MRWEYSPICDRMGHRVQNLFWRPPKDRARAGDRREREMKVSQTGLKWRRRLWLQSGLAALAGPLGPVIGGPVWLALLYGWMAEMGYWYGLPMDRPDVQEQMRARLYRAIKAVLEPYPTWKLIGLGIIWGWGSEVRVADRAMAQIRGQFQDWCFNSETSIP